MGEVMKLNLVALTAFSLLALSGCATSTVSSADMADNAAIDRHMPSTAQSPYGAMPALEANQVPVRLEP